MIMEMMMGRNMQTGKLSRTEDMKLIGDVWTMLQERMKDARTGQMLKWYKWI